MEILTGMIVASLIGLLWSINVILIKTLFIKEIRDSKEEKILTWVASGFFSIAVTFLMLTVGIPLVLAVRDFGLMVLLVPIGFVSIVASPFLIRYGVIHRNELKQKVSSKLAIKRAKLLED